MQGWQFIEPLPAHRTELALVMCRLRPAVSYWVLYKIRLIFIICYSTAKRRVTKMRETMIKIEKTLNTIIARSVSGKLLAAFP